MIRSRPGRRGARLARALAIGFSTLAWLFFTVAQARAQGVPEGGAGKAAPAPAAVSEAQEVRRVFNLLVAATNRLDATAEGGFYWRSPDLISVAQGTTTLGWETRDANARSWYARLERQRVHPGDVEVRGLAPGVVAVVATIRQEVRAKDGREWTGRGAWSLVFRRLDGEWKIVVEHYAYEE